MMRNRAGLAAVLTAVFALAAPAGAQRAAPLPWQEDPFPSRYQTPPPDDMLLRGATILDGAGGRIDGGDVLIRGGKIAAVGKGLANPGVREVDAAGRWVTPGVIDVHSHDGTFVLPLTSIDREASDVSEVASPNSADTWIETAVNAQDMAFDRALSNGVTTIQILPGSTPIFAGHSVVVKPVRAPTVWGMKATGGVQGFKMACGENPKSWGADDDNEGPTSRQGVVTYMRQQFLNARRYKRAVEQARAGTGAMPPRDLKLEALAGILSGDIRVNVHCYRAGDIAAVLTIAREFGFRVGAIHHATEAYKIPGLLREAGTCAAVWADWWGFKLEAQDAVRAEAPLLERAGVCVMMHSDSPADGQRLNIAAAKAAAAGRRIGIDTPPETMIKWTTSNPAKLLGLDKRIGTIAPGYQADVVLWSGDPFSVYSRADLVLIDGAVAWDRARPPSRPVSDFELGRGGVEP
ncbi:amidohydrolase family protein [Sphingopyxis panaciterrulae]|uniref:Imidazolonepropionase-like amidohydrolase n=1 Tax=Sphingopyxis panaciterrulae TaxID=462372 RepID=A0A7W9ESR1_9SPHN|nr:amidohydrolase family protein [Sphingopyxis panaciterrulae]MBB5707206.1 imidazolonepropionase-like amidohydrolase [Sphingopyxis panaciterrulae]